MHTEDQLAIVKEIVPRTLHSLFLLRITLCVVAAVLALIKVCLVPPGNDILLDIFADPSTRDIFLNWSHVLNLLVSGLLASVLALVVATFFIQARIRSHAEEGETSGMPAGTGSNV